MMFLIAFEHCIILTISFIGILFCSFIDMPDSVFVFFIVFYTVISILSE